MWHRAYCFFFDREWYNLERKVDQAIKEQNKRHAEKQQAAEERQRKIDLFIQRTEKHQDRSNTWHRLINRDNKLIDFVLVEHRRAYDIEASEYNNYITSAESNYKRAISALPHRWYVRPDEEVLAKVARAIFKVEEMLMLLYQTGHRSNRMWAMLRELGYDARDQSWVALDPRVKHSEEVIAQYKADTIHNDTVMQDIIAQRKAGAHEDDVRHYVDQKIAEYEASIDGKDFTNEQMEDNIVDRLSAMYGSEMVNMSRYIGGLKDEISNERKRSAESAKASDRVVKELRREIEDVRRDIP